MKRLAMLALIGLLGSGPALADVVPVELEDVRHQRAELLVMGAQGMATYTAADLEALGSYRMTTVTPWREDMTAFDGALLSDVLAANGLADVSAIRIVAENGYATEMEASIWENYPVLLATRVDGRPHSRRARGPIQFILPMSDSPEVGAVGMGKYWVWMAARIEPVD